MPIGAFRLNDISKYKVAATPTYAVAAAGGATSVNEGSSLTFNVTTTNITNGTTLYWTSSNTTDFSTTSGSFTITSNAGSFSVTPTADLTTEGAETFTVSVRTTSTAGTIVATSATITINDTSTTPAPTYSVAAAGGVTSINEGSTLTFNVTGTNITNGTYYWTTSIATDFSATSGSFTITSNAGSFSVTPTADLTTEGAETFTVSVRTGSVSGTIVATSATITINDTSITPAPTATVTPVAFNINEGSALTVNVSTTNFTSGTLYWTINHSTTAAADFSVVSGSFTITASAGSFTVTPTADAATEGAQTFTLSVRTTSTAGTIIGTSASITVNDTSTAPVITTRADAYASSLRLALPFSTQSQKDDVAFRVSGSPNTVMLTPTEAAGGTLVSPSKFYTVCYQPATSGIGYTLPVAINTTNTFFIEFWAKTTSTDINNWIFSNDYNSAREWTIGLNVGGTTPTNLTPNVGNGRIGGLASNTWYHFAFSNANWWLNGTRRGTCNWGGTGYSTTTIWVGRQKDYTIFNGQIQDFRIYVGTNKGVTTGAYTVPLSILT